MSRTTRIRDATVIAVVATVIGALLGAAHEGEAAQQVKPANQSPPTISGTPQQGQTLTADPGAWNGTQPIRFDYQWRRCGGNGGSCSNISGAIHKSYTLKGVDVGNTLRVRVTARNADGESSATSVPTAVIRAAAPPPAPTGCPSGSGTMNVSDVSPPARLLIDAYTSSPSVIGRSTSQLQLRFHVSACNGRAVQGALVYVTAVPFSQFSIPPETPTGADGWATLQMSKLAGFPAARRQQLLVVFGRARKPGENVLAGISTRRLVSFPVNLAA
jgi:hypothetical protein